MKVMLMEAQKSKWLEVFALMKNSHRARILCTNERIPGWRISSFALLIALVIGSAGQRSPAHAAPAGADQIDFELSVYPERLPRICVDTKLNLYAGVSKSVHKEIGGKVWDLPGTAPNPGITGVKVSGPGELKKQLQDIDGPPGSSIPFVFTSDEPGKVTLKFTVYIENKWIGAQEEVIGSSVKREKEVKFTVIPCKVKATTIGEWHVRGLANLHVVAISGDAEVTADEQGSYTGSTSVNWAATSSGVGDCPPAVIEIGSSRVDWTGEMDEAGQLTLHATYLPAQGGVSVNCGTSGTVPVQLTPDPIQLSLASSGGAFRQPQVLEGPGADPGYVTIIVSPEEDEAVVFIEGSPAALAPRAWWATLWDFFPGSYSVLLTLRQQGPWSSKTL